MASLFVLVPGSLADTLKIGPKLPKDQWEQETNQCRRRSGRKHRALFTELSTVVKEECVLPTSGCRGRARRPSSPLHLSTRCPGAAHTSSSPQGTQHSFSKTSQHLLSYHHKGRGGRKEEWVGLSAGQSNPINQIRRDSMQSLWHLMETPTFTTRHNLYRELPKTSVLWATVSSSTGKLFPCIIITFLNVSAYRLVSFYLSPMESDSWDCHSEETQKSILFNDNCHSIALSSRGKSWLC